MSAFLIGAEMAVSLAASDSSAGAPEGAQATDAAGDDVLADDDVLIEDLLVEDVSIDGMCGVY